MAHYFETIRIAVAEQGNAESCSAILATRSFRRFSRCCPLGQSDYRGALFRAAFRQNLRMASGPAYRRRYPRLDLPKGMLVAWQAGAKRTVSRVSTLGVGGIFIATGNPPPAGEALRLIFEIPSGVVRARGVVRVSQPGRGMGVEFTAMSSGGRVRLDQLVRRLLI